MEPIRFRGTLTARDLIPGLRYTQWHRSWIFKGFAAWAVFMLAAAALDTARTGVKSAVGLIPGALLMAFVILQPKLAVRSQMRSHRHMQEEGTYEFGSEGFRISRPSLEVAVPWNAVHSVVELSGEFLLFSNSSCFHAVPKRFIPADAENSWREVIQGPYCAFRKAYQAPVGMTDSA